MSHNYISVKHGKIFYQKFGAGSPIVILHGGPGLDQSYLLPQMLELSKDHEIIFYDQRGSGKSLNTPLTLDYINIDQFYDDLEALRKRLGLKQFILLGHSWGSTLAMYYAAKYPNYISKLILLNSAPVNFVGLRMLMSEFKKRTIPINNKITALTNYNEFEKLNTQEVINLYRILFSVYFYDASKVNKLTLQMNKVSAVSGFKVMDLISASQGPDFNLLPILKTIKAPTLIVHGAEDIMPTQIAQQINDGIPNSQLVYLPECGHFSFVEQPTGLFAAIQQFLRQ
ncbi:MAG: alpha/beta fold hydrolase [Gammaproteobacteria bacterium]|nr:alpha/beta fold hydrolase [Gammaproteobacteria bacterium]